MTLIRSATVFFAMLVTSMPTALAQSAESAGDYPNKTIRLIVPFPAGSGPDANARVLIGGLARPLGQQLVI